MSEFGIRIKNIEAATLFAYNLGVRESYQYVEAMLPNSLLNDFLLEHGLEVRGGESTRDIICLEFNYGSRSYAQEMDHLRLTTLEARAEHEAAILRGDAYLIRKSMGKRLKLNELVETAYQKKDLFREYSKEELRRVYYNEGCDVHYYTHDKDGNRVLQETIHYMYLFRSAGKAKKGTCMFIREELYELTKDYLYMGIKLPDHGAKIVEVSAYSSLVASGIVGRIKIDPDNILVLNDVSRYFETNIVSVETDEKQRCVARRIDKYELKNEMFDGQALIDSSIFPDWGNGYILLRQHFCKMAAFKTHIQKFFRDKFGDEYDTATVTDMFGNEMRVKDVLLVTTNNALKFLKMGYSYDYWKGKVRENGCLFGIVKTAHPSKLGRYQKMSYQMVNSLDAARMDAVLADTKSYILQLKNDIPTFKEFLYRNQNFANDYSVMLALCDWNSDFERSSYFRNRKKKIVDNYILTIKRGEIIQDADNLTIVGSPYAMLLYAATGNESDCDMDDTFCYEKGTIQCYAERFNDGIYLAGFRSPFNGKYNMSYLHNVYSDIYKKYFDLGKQVIAVNMNGTDFQDRNNGLTNWPRMLETA